jgi:hypothetical protein
MPADAIRASGSARNPLSLPAHSPDHAGRNRQFFLRVGYGRRNGDRTRSLVASSHFLSRTVCRKKFPPTLKLNLSTGPLFVKQIATENWGRGEALIGREHYSKSGQWVSEPSRRTPGAARSGGKVGLKRIVATGSQANGKLHAELHLLSPHVCVLRHRPLSSYRFLVSALSDPDIPLSSLHGRNQPPPARPG